MKHKHCELIKKWADRARRQGHLARNVRADLAEPRLMEGTEYRVKPETVKYRVALFADGVLSTTKPENEKRIERFPCFIRWLTDWVEVEI